MPGSSAGVSISAKPPKTFSTKGNGPTKPSRWMITFSVPGSASKVKRQGVGSTLRKRKKSGSAGSPEPGGETRDWTPSAQITAVKSPRSSAPTPSPFGSTSATKPGQGAPVHAGSDDAVERERSYGSAVPSEYAATPTR